jgi:hypothetical protein
MQKLITRWYVMGKDESIVDGPYHSRGAAVDAMLEAPGYIHWPFWFRIEAHTYPWEPAYGDFEGLSGWQITSRLLKAEYDRAKALDPDVEPRSVLYLGREK